MTSNHSFGCTGTETLSFCLSKMQFRFLLDGFNCYCHFPITISLQIAEFHFNFTEVEFFTFKNFNIIILFG